MRKCPPRFRARFKNRKKTVNELLLTEIEQVSGGDSWAGSAEGRAPAESDKFQKCVTEGFLGGGKTMQVFLKCAIETWRD